MPTLQYGNRDMASKLWKQLVVQYDSTDPAEMAVMMKRAMTDDNSSVLYRVQSVTINSHYEGLVNTRPAIQRKLEHDKCIVDHKFRPEKRYAFMHKHGGAATWWYTPIVVIHPKVLNYPPRLEHQKA